MRPSKKYSTYPAGSKDVLGALKHLIYPNQCDLKRPVLNLAGFCLSVCLSWPRQKYEDVIQTKVYMKLKDHNYHRQIGLFSGDVVQKSKDLSQW